MNTRIRVVSSDCFIVGGYNMFYHNKVQGFCNIWTAYVYTMNYSINTKWIKCASIGWLNVIL